MFAAAHTLRATLVVCLPQNCSDLDSEAISAAFRFAPLGCPPSHRGATEKPVRDPVRLVTDPVRVVDDPVRAVGDPVRLADDQNGLSDDPWGLSDDPCTLLDDSSFL